MVYQRRADRVLTEVEVAEVSAASMLTPVRTRGVTNRTATYRPTNRLPPLTNTVTSLELPSR